MDAKSYHKEYVERKLAEGLCVSCGNKPLHTKRLCESCAQKAKEYARKKYPDRLKQRQESGVCVSCGVGVVLPDRSQCNRCIERSTAYRQLLKDECYKAYGGYVCNCCDETEPAFLTIDHVNDDGAKMRKKESIKGGLDQYRWLKKNNFPEGYQILCWNCQQGKRFNDGICPHQKYK